MSEILHYLIRRLGDGKFHSGMALGAELNLSRAAVWKHIRKMSALGIDVHSVRGKGYRMVHPVSLMETGRILEGFPPALKNRLHCLEILHSVDSTNSHAMRLLQNGSLEPGSGQYAVYLAEQQTQGKGRRGRRWVSPFGRNIYLTLVRRLDAGTMGTEGISLVVGLSIIRALEEFSISGVGIKWPNDILCDGEKLAGILLEITGDIAGVCQILVGVGVNVMCEPEMMRQVAQPWTDLQRITGRQPDRNRLVNRILGNVIEAMDEFERGGFEAFIDEWDRLDVMKGRKVELVTSGGSQYGMAMGVTATGALRLETPAGIQTFNGGEISMRGLAS